MIAYVDRKHCTGCGACVSVCPVQAVQLADGVAQIDASLCLGCEACVDICPERAIVSVSEPIASESRIVPAASPPGRSAPAAPIVHLTSRARPWVGAALAFVAREIIPRLMVSLLDVWDRQRASLPPTDRRSMDRGMAADVRPGGGLRQHRWRHRQR